MKSESEKVGIPIIAYPVLLVVVAGAVGIVIDDLRIMYVIFIVFALSVIVYILPPAAGIKIKRKGKIFKVFEEGDVAVTAHCTKHMVGGRPIVVEYSGKIIAKLWHGDALSLPLKPEVAELFVYRNKHEKTKAQVAVREGSEIFLWFYHGQTSPTRLVQITAGEPLPELKPLESYKKMKKTMIIFVIPTAIIGGIFILFSLRELGLMP